MAQVDFAVAFVVIFMMVSYSVFFVSNRLSNDFDYFNAMEKEVSVDSLSSQLLYGNGLVYKFKRMQVLLEEVGGYQHTENIVITMGDVSKAHVYNLTMVELPSSYSAGNISFSADMMANEEKYLSIIYDGSAEGVSYYGAENVTARILFEEDVPVLSQDKCNALKSLSYDETKNNLGFNHNFRIDNHCVYGENPPEDADIIIKTFPIMIENQDGTVYPDYVTLKVW